MMSALLLSFDFVFPNMTFVGTAAHIRGKSVGPAHTEEDKEKHKEHCQEEVLRH